jgi:hypothetical protein
MLKIEISLTEQEYQKLLKINTNKQMKDINAKIKYLALSHASIKAENILLELQNSKIKKIHNNYDFLFTHFLKIALDFRKLNDV